MQYVVSGEIGGRCPPVRPVPTYPPEQLETQLAAAETRLGGPGFAPIPCFETLLECDSLEALLDWGAPVSDVRMRIRAVRSACEQYLWEQFLAIQKFHVAKAERLLSAEEQAAREAEQAKTERATRRPRRAEKPTGQDAWPEEGTLWEFAKPIGVGVKDMRKFIRMGAPVHIRASDGKEVFRRAELIAWLNEQNAKRLSEEKSVKKLDKSI